MILSSNGFDLREFNGAVVSEIWGLNERVASDGTIIFDEFIIRFGESHLRISVDLNRDEILVSSKTEHVEKFAAIESLSYCVGKEFGWSWVAVNSNGYVDCVMFSFSVLSPEICLVAESSALNLYYLSNLKPVLAS